MKLSLFLVSLILSSAWARDYDSKETQAIFLDLGKTCKKAPYFDAAKSYREIFFERLDKKDFYSEEFSQKFEDSLRSAQCDEALIEKYVRSFKRDLYPFHESRLEKIKKEAFDFQERKLNTSFHINKYNSYKKKFGIEFARFDEQVNFLKTSASGYSQKRKESCSDVVNLKAPLSLDRPKDQDTIGWCYAYATSDLIAHATGKEPSAAYMAQLINETVVWETLGIKQGGLIQLAYHESLQKGICLEKDLPSTDYAFSIGNKDHNLNFVFKNVAKFRREFKKKKFKSIEEVKESLCALELSDPLKELFPALSLDDIAKVIMASKNSSTVFKELADASCPLQSGNFLKDFKVKSFTTIYALNQNKVNMEKWKIIDEQMNKGNIIGLHYDSKMLYDYQSNRPYFDHVSTLVGRRFNEKTGSCEYLLRNSWGKLCPKSFVNFECQNGHYWIPEQFFQYNEAIKQIVYLEKK